MEGLGFDYIFGENEIDNLFTDDESSVEETTEDAGTKEIEDTGEEEKKILLRAAEILGVDLG